MTDNLEHEFFTKVNDRIKLLKGDCIEIMPSLGDVDLVLSDPPYGITQNKWDSIIDLKKMWEVLPTRPETAIVLTASQPFTSLLISSNRDLFRYCWVWVKNLKTGNLNARRMPMGGHEDVVVFYKRQPTYNPQKRIRKNEIPSGNKKNSKTSVYGKQREYYLDRQSDLINPDTALLGINCVHNSSGRVHPNQKPVELMEYLIRTYTNEGDTVLDFAMGSGTTGIACINTNRNFIGIELDNSYFEVAKERINTAMGE